MTANHSSDVPSGWIGGFAESKPAFAYPNSPSVDPPPDLSSLKMYDNMDNIPKIQRGWSVNWPEFSWQTVSGEPDSRCFQMFVPDLSRVGYDDTGRIWSIICPQQGSCVTDIVCFNVEITVTGTRGWVNEETREIAADMTVEGKIWFTPSSHQSWLVQKAWDMFKDKKLPFPYKKANAIRITTFKANTPDQPIFPVVNGKNQGFEIPEFAIHEEAWTNGTLAVEIGPIIKYGHPALDTFNQKLVDIFNLSSGNMLTNGNILTWNVWFTPPAIVDTKEWAEHAHKWRESIDADHGSPGGDAAARPAKYFDGTLFKAPEQPVEEMEDFLKLIESLL